MPPGYHGQYLRIDLTNQTSTVCTLSEKLLQTAIGGVGLGAALLLHESPAAPLQTIAQAPIVIAFSPLVGSPISTSAKFAVVSHSPLTNRFNDSLSSSTFALAGKRTGYDAIVITGACENWSTLIVTDSSVRLVNSSQLLGLSAAQTQSRLQELHGLSFQALAIGSAGELGVKYATLSHGSRHAGRGGHGAVWGAKRLKGLAVDGSRRTEAADAEGLARYARTLARQSLGPATAKYRNTGTLGNLNTFHRLKMLPTQNFQAVEFQSLADSSELDVKPGQLSIRDSCASCQIGCEHGFIDSSDDQAVRMEYESVYALGSMCRISDRQALITAVRQCDFYGLDTISTGVCIAFQMECAQRGLIDDHHARFGHANDLHCLIEEIGTQTHRGLTLSQGVRHAAQQIGQQSHEFAAHVKGLEMPGYDPRLLPSMAIGLAVTARGADHNRSSAYEVDMQSGVDRRTFHQSQVQQIIEAERDATLLDSLILCKFLRGVFQDRAASMAEMLSLVTGWPCDANTLAASAQTILQWKHLYNLRQGWTIAEDTLPLRFLKQPDDTTHPSPVIGPAQLPVYVSQVHQLRGFDANGIADAQRQSDLLSIIEQGMTDSHPVSFDADEACCS